MGTVTLYSSSGEDFNFDAPSEALADLDSDGLLEIGANYWSHEFERVDLARYLRADDILEVCEERLYDDIGDTSDDAFSADTEAVAELQAMLNEWAAKHLHAECWEAVGSKVTHTVTAEDIADFRK